MGKYIVTTDFKDLQDDNYIYRARDPFPRKGKSTKKRIEELSTIANKRKEILIKEVVEIEEE